MAPTRPEPEEDCGRPPGAPDRRPLLPRTTPVSGPAEVQARLELHLAQCRRRGGVLALLCVSVDAVAGSGDTVSAHFVVRSIDPARHRLLIDAWIENETGQRVLEGVCEAGLLPVGPSQREMEHLRSDLEVGG